MGIPADLMNAHVTVAEQPCTINKNDSVPAGENKYLYHPEKGLKLCADLISSPFSENIGYEMLDSLENLLENDFLQLTKTDRNPRGAEAYHDLVKLHRDMIEKVSFPNLEKFYTVAVGGMFSAGKSRFLNSVMGCPSLLPTDTIPTTSIPTYINKGKKDSISVLNYYRKKTVIDEEALKAICHAFNERYNVTFSHLLRLISIERKDFRFPLLTFLDTPGYSKPDKSSGNSGNTDESLAKEHLRNTDYLIWLVDCQNGTVPVTDIHFITQLEIEQPILFVISKADKKMRSEIMAIIDAAKKDLDQYNVPYFNVIGYSAAKNNEFSDTGDVLQTFFKTISKGRDGTYATWQANRIFKNFLDYYDSEKEHLRLTLKMANELLYDEKLEKRNMEILKNIKTRTKERIDLIAVHKRTAEKIKKKFVETIQNLCEAAGIRISEQPTRVQIETFRKHNEQNENSYRFQAICTNGDPAKLMEKGDFTQISGTVEKISPVGVIIKSNCGHEIIIQKAAVQSETGLTDLNELFKCGNGVMIQLISREKCVVHYNANI